MIAAAPSLLSARRVSNAALLRALLGGGCVATIAIVSLLAASSAAVPRDAELTTLLHGMAAIKALLVAPVVAAVAWRLGLPSRPGIATAYVAGACVLVGATTAIAWLVALVPAAIVFHATGLALLWIALRDDAVPRPRRRAAVVTRDDVSLHAAYRPTGR